MASKQNTATLIDLFIKHWNGHEIVTHMNIVTESVAMFSFPFRSLISAGNVT